MSKQIIIEISDKYYEELIEQAKEVQKAGVDAHDELMSEHDIIRHAAELGLIPHIKNAMDILERNLKNKAAKNK